MKRNTRSIFSLLLALVLMMSLLPLGATARAEDGAAPAEGPATAEVAAYDLFVGGVQVTDANKGNILGDGKVSFDPASRTLTLDGATVKGADLREIFGADRRMDIAILSALEDGLTILLKGSNTVTAARAEDDKQAEAAAVSVGMYSDAPLTISGTGSLNVSGGAAESSYGIQCGDIRVLYGVVTASGGTAAMSSAPSVAEGAVVTAAPNSDGSGADSYVPADIGGYRFLNIKPGAVNPSAGEGEEPVSDTWPVHFFLDGEELGEELQNVVTGESAKEPAYKPASGELDGWYTDEACTKKYDFSAKVSEELKLYARTMFTVMFDPANGEDARSVDVAKGKTVEKPADPSWAEHKFIEWQKDGAAYDFSAPVNADLNLTAAWKNIWTLRYDANGGSGTMASEKVLEGESLTLTDNDFSREKHRFDGWNTAADGSGTSYEDGASVTPTANMTLYAQWVKQVTITFDTDGGSAVKAQTFDEGKTGKMPTTSKEGFEFGGWTLDGEAYDFTKPVWDDITLKAVWIEVEYNFFPDGTITYGKKGGKDLELLIKRNVNNGSAASHFDRVLIDGKELIEGTDFTYKQGDGLVLTLDQTKLKKIALGKHTLTVEFDDGVAETRLMIQMSYVAPRTGDSGPALWSSAMALSALAACAAVIARRRRRDSEA